MNVIIEELKQRITAVAAKVKRYQGQVYSYRQTEYWRIIKGRFIEN